MKFLLQISLCEGRDSESFEHTCHMQVRDDATPDEFVASMASQSQELVAHILTGVVELLSARAMHSLKNIGQAP